MKPGLTYRPPNIKIRGSTLNGAKTHVRRERLSEKSIYGQQCPLNAIQRLKTLCFERVFHCPQCFDLSDKKSLMCETVPLSVNLRDTPPASEDAHQLLKPLSADYGTIHRQCHIQRRPAPPCRLTAFRKPVSLLCKQLCL